MGGYNHKKGCPCKVCVPKHKKRKTRPARQEQTDVKASQVEPAQAEAQAFRPGAVELGKDAQGQIQADKLPVQADEIKTIGQPDSPVKQAGQQSELDRLMKKFSAGSDKPPDVPVDQTAPVKPAGQIDSKPPAPDLPVSGAPDSAKMVSLMAKLSKYRPEDMPLIVTSIAKAPFETMNALKRTSRFSLTEKEAQGLAVQMIQCAEMFGWDVVNKWVMLFGLVSSIVILGAEKWRLPEPAKKTEPVPEKPKEEPKENVEDPEPADPGSDPVAPEPNSGFPVSKK